MGQENPAAGFVRSRIRELARDHLLHRPRVAEQVRPGRCTVDGREILCFCSNDYLGLASDRRLAAASAAELVRSGAGSGAARLLAGTRPAHVALETELARALGEEAALLFSCGYLANVGLIPALVGPGDTICSDEHNHASIIDGCRLSRGRTLVHRHCDPDDLRRRLSDAGPGHKLVLTESVFSMEGSLAPLPEIGKAAAEAGAMLVVDEAHAFGILGPRGAGAAADLPAGLRPQLRVVTLGKALGAAGAVVAGPQEIIEYLASTSRTFLFSTALPPATVAAAAAALTIVSGAEGEERRGQLAANGSRLRHGLAALGARLAGTAPHIVPVLIGDEQEAMRVSSRLLDLGIWAPAIRAPTVAPGAARLRFSVCSAHSAADIEQAIAALGRALRP